MENGRCSYAWLRNALGQAEEILAGSTSRMLLAPISLIMAKRISLHLYRHRNHWLMRSLLVTWVSWQPWYARILVRRQKREHGERPAIVAALVRRLCWRGS